MVTEEKEDKWRKRIRVWVKAMEKARRKAEENRGIAEALEWSRVLKREEERVKTLLYQSFCMDFFGRYRKNPIYDENKRLFDQEIVRGLLYNNDYYMKFNNNKWVVFIFNYIIPIPAVHSLIRTIVFRRHRKEKISELKKALEVRYAYRKRISVNSVVVWNIFKN